MGIGVIMALFLVGLGLIICEVFVPGGIVGSIGTVLVIGSVWGAFADGHTLMGIVLIVVALVVGPLTIITSIRRFSLRTRQTKQDGYTAGGKGIEALVGKRGVALSALHPSGTARIENRKLSVVTQGEMIDANTQLEVISVEGNRVVVQAARVR